ncbi:unnamed protein product, partial [Ilex paraguariensis]
IPFHSQLSQVYLDGKINDSVKLLLIDSTTEGIAFISPWLCIFGKDKVKKVVEQKIEFFLEELEEKHVVITLEAIVEAFMTSISISELEASRAVFSKILGPRIACLISKGSQDLITVSAKAITDIFTMSDYCNYLPSLETIGAVDKLASILDNCEDPMIQTSLSNILAKLAEFGSSNTVDKVLHRFPINRLADLLSPLADDWHESVLTTLMSLIKAGKSRTIERMFAFEIDKSLIKLLEIGSEVVQNNAIVTLKTFYELGGPAVNRSLRPVNLNLLPWQARLRLEKLVLSDRNPPSPPKPQTFEELVHKLLDSDNKQVLEAMEMILQSPLIKRLSELLQHGKPEQNSIKSELVFTLMKLACSGGEPFIKKFLDYNIIPELVKMMQCNTADLHVGI